VLILRRGDKWDGRNGQDDPRSLIHRPQQRNKLLQIVGYLGDVKVHELVLARIEFPAAGSRADGIGRTVFARDPTFRQPQREY